MSFQDRAMEYDEFAIIQRWFIDWAWNHFSDVAYLKDKEILELGVGTGLLTSYIHECAPRKIWAVDNSSSMLHVAAQKFGDAKNIQWILGDAWNVKMYAVDYIFSSHLLQWAINPEEVLRSWKQLMKPSARALFIFFTEGTLQELYQIVPECNFLKWKTHLQWNSLMMDVGLNVLATDNNQYVANFKSPYDLLKTLRGMGVTRKNHLLSYTQLLHGMHEYEKYYSTANGVTSTWNGCYFWVQAPG